MARKSAFSARLFPETDPGVGRGSGGTLSGKRTSLGIPFASSQLVRGQIAPILERRLGPALAEALARQSGRPGASIEGILQNLEATGGFEISRELSGLQLAAQAGAENLPPSGPSIFESFAEGAIEGGVVGGVPGAIVGGPARAITAEFERRSARKKRKRQEARSVLAQRAATAERFGERLEESEAQAREQALVSGRGAQRAQALEAAITARGLRDTGLGTLGSIAAGVQGPLEELGRTFELALNETRREVAARLGTGIPAQRQKPDRLTQSLEALANFFLTKEAKEDETSLPTLFPEDAPITNEEVTEEGLF